MRAISLMLERKRLMTNREIISFLTDEVTWKVVDAIKDAEKMDPKTALLKLADEIEELFDSMPLNGEIYIYE